MLSSPSLTCELAAFVEECPTPCLIITSRTCLSQSKTTGPQTVPGCRATSTTGKSILWSASSTSGQKLASIQMERGTANSSTGAFKGQMVGDSRSSDRLLIKAFQQCSIYKATGARETTRWLRSVTTWADIRE